MSTEFSGPDTFAPAVELHADQLHVLARFIDEWCVLTEDDPATPDSDIYVTRDHDLWTNFCIWMRLRVIEVEFDRQLFTRLLCKRGLELKGFFWHGIGMPYRKGMAL